ncbi:helix-turn-helix domain-containing protein [Calderihabitans maritimus]|uniref:Helix-turn-helix domain-containing protein n=1 Tax=Calderihabitans maritimus TaxID=1246530 RepID=A0A1Z5HPS6_9FIRM|nr:helix-turn-helix domain-containing protein [Calderihabitans maritimus]GAW91305.1 hypothetical protein TTE1826 [Calderihabitans maritimus]
MKELGQILRKQRCNQGIHLEEVERSTKIWLKYLKAMEEGDFEAIPGEFYLRGFLRSYADYIGLDGNAVVQYYQQLKEEKNASGTERRKTTGRKRSFARQIFGSLYKVINSIM